ncbi:DUF7146 domain-containing protein [Oceaniglobus trochenteri]|uniref:DUF7146 domain-containing protein n=1 Tax=Oceaniglobus trochenteri TaxID=2763260 RepID=UPI001D0003B8|nr:toprim domain-containing protein [Oceaniglobus trochenteri]
MTARPYHTLDEIKSLLLAQMPGVAYHYAPWVKGAYENQGNYFTLNPGRADRNVGSFWVRLTGAKAGSWQDKATGQFGDILDLIKLHLGCSNADALREARAYLGLDTEDPATRRIRAEAAEKAKAQRKEAEARLRATEARRARQAQAIWLSAQPGIAGTPVEAYLRDQRAIDLRRLGRQPGALRYAPACYFKQIDAETGECFEGEGPAMVAAITRDGKHVSTHRTWLARGRDGVWGKAPLPKAKMVLGNYAGGCINLWRGTRPDGKKPPSLAMCPPGTRVYITEGIEDALTAMMMLPHARHLTAIAIGNFAQVRLPANVAEVIILGDNDGDLTPLNRALEAHRAEGRRAGVYLPRTPGCKDLNDEWRALLAQETRDQRREVAR